MGVKQRCLAVMLLVLCLFGAEAPEGISETDTQIFARNTEAVFSVHDFNEEKTFTIPDGPLHFPTEVRWEMGMDVSVPGGSTSGAYGKVFIVDERGYSKQEAQITPTFQTGSGIIMLKPGQLCRFNLYAGKNKHNGKNTGVKVSASCIYNDLYVSVNEMNAAGKFKMSADGPSSIKQWFWKLPDGKTLSGTDVEAIFEPGPVTVYLYNSKEGKNPFSFTFQAPEVFEASPRISSTEGYADFTVICDANVKNHYQSSSQCFWRFNDGTPLQEGPSIQHTFNEPGTYKITLLVKNSLGSTIEKSWDITVYPFNLSYEAEVTPVRGPVPLTVNFSAGPKIIGDKPVVFSYLWDFGDGTISRAASGKHTYKQLGEYKIQLKVEDLIHREIKLPPWTSVVTAMPPVLTVSANAAPRNGFIPLSVSFNAKVDVVGKPTDLVYLWDFNDGTKSNVKNPVHIFTKPGQYIVDVSVSDQIHNTTVTDRLIINAFSPAITPQSSFGPLSGAAPLKVTGECKTTAEGLPANIKHRWYIGDVFICEGRMFEYTFTKPGIYKVSLQVIDDIQGHTGWATQIWQVTVTEPE